MSINVLLNNQNNILYELPLGKPDPTYKFTQEPDLRPRVFQKKQLTFSCCYYSFNRIRDRIGKHPENIHLNERHIEKNCSIRQKKLTEVTSLYLMSNDTQNDIHKLAIAKLIINYEFANALELNLNQYYLRNFCEGQLLGTTLEGLYNQASLNQMSNLVEVLTNNMMADQYGLEKTNWSPSQKIDSLISVLKNRGPMVVQGFFGQSRYSVSPKILKKIKGIDIYGWPEDSSQSQVIIMNQPMGHFVVVIGAAKSERRQEVVYFIDPGDSSDPRDKTSQKVHMISYQNFIDNIFNSNGRVYSSKAAPSQSHIAQLNSIAKWGHHGTQRQIRATKRALHEYDQKMISLSVSYAVAVCVLAIKYFSVLQAALDLQKQND